MKKNRNIPFGYCMKSGEIQANPIESNAVKEIFASYLGGNSFNEIARAMTSKKIPYSEVSMAWNKNMVKRILENEKYLGKGDFTAFIDENTFNHANEKKHQKSTRNGDISEDLKAIRSLTYCKKCGKKLSRIGGNSRNTKWDCKNPECSKFEFRLTDKMLIKAILNILNRVVENSDLLDISEENLEYSPSLEVTRQHNEISRIFDSPNPDFEKTKEEIFRFAALKYDCCTYDDRSKKTAYVRDLLTEKEPLNTLDIGLLKSTVSRILIGHFYTLEIEFINGKIVELEVGKNEKFELEFFDNVIIEN